MMCHAHAQLDDSFDEEYEVANYNLAQVAELEAARRLQAGALTQEQCNSQASSFNSVSDPMQIDNLVHHQQNQFAHHHQFGNYHQLPASSVNTSRKLKRGCEFDNANAFNNAEFERSNKRIKAAF